MKKFSTWGPKISVSDNKTVQGENYNEGYPDSITTFKHSEKIGYSKAIMRNNIDVKPKRILPPTIKIKYGLWQVLLGFALLAVFSFAISIVFILWELRHNLTAAVNDPDIITQALNDVTANPALIVSSALAMYVAWMIAVKDAAKKAFTSVRKTFRIYFKRKDIFIGLALALTMRGLETVALIPFHEVFENEEGNAASAVGFDGIWYILNAIVIASLLAPLFEEIFFRGLFLSATLRKFTQWRKFRKGQVDWFYKSRYIISIVFTSTIFGLMHFPAGSLALNLVTTIETGIVGAILAYTTIRAKRLGPAIITHIFFNMSGVILATLSG